MKISRTKDYEKLAQLNKTVHDLHYALYPLYFMEYNFEKIKDYFKKQIDNEKFIFVLLEDEGKDIGYAWFEIREYRESIFTKPYNSLFVHQISIDEAEKGKGYGTQLMDYIEHYARDKGIGLVELDYWAKNTAASSFYEKQGYAKYREFVYKEL